MAKGIIHAFEIVHVQRQQAQGLASGSSSLQCVFKPLMKMAAIGEAGQPIVARCPEDMFSSGLGLRDVQMSAQEASVSVPLWSRSEEHTSELQSLMRNSYAVFCLKKKKPHSKLLHINDVIYLKKP